MPGAAGDGVTDDTLALRAALAGQRVVDLGGPENVYLITGTLTLDQAAGRRLTGRGATILAGTSGLTLLDLVTGGHTVDGLVLHGGTAIVVRGAGVRIGSCAFDGVESTGVRVAGGGERVIVNRCAFRSSGQLAVAVEGAKYATVTGNDVQGGGGFRFGSGSIGFTCRGNTLTGATGIVVSGGRSGSITGNTITGGTGDAIVSEASSALVIAGNTVSGGSGVSVTGTTVGVTIRGNTFRDVRLGVQLADTGGSVRGVLITGNTILQPAAAGVQGVVGASQIAGLLIADNSIDVGGAGTYGVALTGVDSSQIRDNRVHRPKADAIRLDAGAMIQVAGNTVRDAGYPGAVADGVSVNGSDRVFVRDNVAYGGGRAVFLNAATNATVAGTRWRSADPSAIQDTAESATLLENVVLTGCRIMALGDSITDGMDRTRPGAYRKVLRQLLLAANYSIDFVGTRYNRAGDLPDPDHQGYEGKKITDLDVRVEAALRATVPHVVLLHIGTNDVSDLTLAVATLEQQLGVLVDRIHGVDARIDLFVAKIIDRPVSATIMARIKEYNAAVQRVADARVASGRRIRVVDMYPLLTVAAGDYEDGTHPNDQGYAKMAQKWFDGLVAVPGALSAR
ncbi:hypothetical protein GCM10010436_05720 [Paractinoplanes durhamensis]